MIVDVSFIGRVRAREYVSKCVCVCVCVCVCECGRARVYVCMYTSDTIRLSGVCYIAV